MVQRSSRSGVFGRNIAGAGRIAFLGTLPTVPVLLVILLMEASSKRDSHCGLCIKSPAEAVSLTLVAWLWQIVAGMVIAALLATVFTALSRDAEAGWPRNAAGLVGLLLPIIAGCAILAQR